MYLFVIVFLIKIIKKNNLLKHCKDKNKKHKSNENIKNDILF